MAIRFGGGGRGALESGGAAGPRLRRETWGTRICGSAILLAGLIFLAGAAAAFAQYPTAKKTEKKSANPRAVAVLEWVGAPGKPSASRLIPVSIFIDGALQDGGLYLARPEPMTLESGTLYELQKSGKPVGMFEVGSAGHVQNGQFPNTWFGYGAWKPLMKPAPPKRIEMAPTRITDSSQRSDADRPTFASGAGSASEPANPAPAPGSPPAGSGKTGAAQAGSSPSSSPSSSSPPSSGSGSSGSKGSTGADTIDSNGNVVPAGSSSGSGSKKGGKDTQSTTQANVPQGSTPAEDTDRPTLKRRSADAADASNPNAAATPATEMMPAPDPNRPRLHRGVRPGDEASGTAPALTMDKLAGTTVHLQQMVAVSDATVRDPHSFDYSWPDSQQPAAMQKQMEALAQKALADAASTSAKAASAKAAAQPATAASGSKARHKAASPAAPPQPALLDEEFHAYELSYDGGLTLVLTAHTAGTGSALKYVTVVAVVDIYGQPQVVLQSVTDAAHLDLTPWMRLVDVVDADDSNRADLLFELHGTGQRQFALYRVARAASSQVLVTDPIP
ncbi:MAG: hypothetical protein ACYCSN_12070 [Acidobacteriaceae bacterium]